MLVQTLLSQSFFWFKIPFKEAGFSGGSSKHFPSRSSIQDASNDGQTFYESGADGTKVPKFDGINAKKTNRCNLKILKRNDKVTQALNLPTICNLNPRSVYNKVEEFHTLVEQEEIDLLFMSESWERDYQTLDQIIKLENHTIISNVHRRTGTGGRPAIFANNSKFEV